MKFLLPILLVASCAAQTAPLRLSGVTAGSYTNPILTINGYGIISAAASGATGTVTSVSVTTANGVSGSVATATTTPAISLSLGNIAPLSVTPTNNFLGKSSHTAAFPDFTWTGDTNTGMLHGNTAQINFVSAGTEYWTMQSDGSFTIGASAIDGTAAKLQVTTSGAGSIISDTSYGGTASIYLRSFGGTVASPSASTTSSQANINAWFLDGAATNSSGRLTFVPTSTHSGGNRGTDFQVNVTTDSTTTRFLAAAVTGKGTVVGDAAVTTPDASAVLQASSTTRGFLAPQMTTTQRDAISSPADGLQVANTTTHRISVRNASRAQWLNGTLSLPAVTVTNWIIASLVVGTPATTTVTVTGATTSDLVVVDNPYFSSGAAIVVGSVTSANTVTLYAVPSIAFVSAQTNDVGVTVIAR